MESDSMVIGQCISDYISNDEEAQNQLREIVGSNVSISVNYQNESKLSYENMDQFEKIQFTTNCLFNQSAIVNDALVEVKQWKKYLIMITQDGRCQIKLETLGLELFRIIPKRKQQQNQMQGTIKFIYMLYAAIQLEDKIVNECIKDLIKSKNWKNIIDSSYLIFGPNEILKQLNLQQQIQNFNLFCQYMEEIGIKDPELCAMINLFVTCIILGDFIRYQKKVEQLDQSSGLSTANPSIEGSLKDFSTTQLDEILELKEELKLDDLSTLQFDQNEILCKDNKKACLQFIFYQFCEWYSKKISQLLDNCSPTDLKFQIIEPASTINLKQKLNFIDVTEIYCYELMMLRYFNYEQKINAKQLVTAMEVVFNENKNYLPEKVVLQLQELINSTKQNKPSSIKLNIYSEDDIIMNLKNVQKENSWCLIPEFQQRLLASDNIILKASSTFNEVITTIEYLKQRLKQFKIVSYQSDPTKIPAIQFNPLSQESSKFPSQKNLIDNNSSQQSNSDSESIYPEAGNIKNNQNNNYLHKDEQNNESDLQYKEFGKNIEWKKE